MGISLTLADSARTSWKFWACRVHRGAMPLYAQDWISIVLTCLRFWTRPKSTSLHRLQDLLRLDTVPELDAVEPPRRAWQTSDWQMESETLDAVRASFWSMRLRVRSLRQASLRRNQVPQRRR